MNQKITKLLEGKEDNYQIPFFWQHGEDEATLRKYMRAIYNANIRAVCIESRPHPDFCGPKWWEDMDVIMDEARKREMKVWILDDSHFPTGYANGALANAPLELHRQSVVSRIIDCSNKSEIKIGRKKLSHPVPFKKTTIEKFVSLSKRFRVGKFDDDRLLVVSAIRMDSRNGVEILNLTDQIHDGVLNWKIPEGKWKIYILHLSRNFGPHRNYINMMNKESCKILIDAVYEPHYNRYKDDFGKTLAGFFSDEPEIGNGHLYQFEKQLGTAIDLPWSRELHKRLEDQLGTDYTKLLLLLWENDADVALTAFIRYTYMDAVTRLVEQDFSYQLGEWCSNRGIEYIGHVIEDNNQHARAGSSLGHFYRGMAGQHMAGIDVVTRQVLPQSEDLVEQRGPLDALDREFFHYALAKLGSSHAAIDPLKKGRAMCEIFGNYGWGEGVRLEKYLADHFMVRGINHFVQHAFSPKKFPDTDCPPHFYAHGHNPQYRHFGHLMVYMNRVCDLISGGRHIASAAILYHGEAEWAGECMFMQKPGRILAENQIEFDFIPQDVFLEIEHYNTTIGKKLHVNTQEYNVLIVPTAQFITKDFAAAIIELTACGFPVIFINELPIGICDSKDSSLVKDLLAKMQDCSVIQLDSLKDYLVENKMAEISISPASQWVRYYHYLHEDGGEIYYFVNEGTEIYSGTLQIPNEGHCYAYNAWNNRLESVEVISAGESNAEITQSGKLLKVEIEPLKSLIICFDKTAPEDIEYAPIVCVGEGLSLNKGWTRSLCAGIDYPNFKNSKMINLPDKLAEEFPKFSGFVRYETKFDINAASKAVLEITDAHEGVEVFINGQNAGIQIVPPYQYDISEFMKEGENTLRIEVATTLERQVGRRGIIAKLMHSKPSAHSGITGNVTLYLN